MLFKLSIVVILSLITILLASISLNINNNRAVVVEKKQNTPSVITPKEKYPIETI